MSIATILPRSLFTLKQENSGLNIIDVRTPAEYAQLHIDGARLVPLDSLNPESIGRDRGHDEPVYILCRSGNRSSKACQILQTSGFKFVIDVEGGVLAWEAANLPVIRGKSTMISLERQVRIGAGSLVLMGSVLGSLVHSSFYGLSAFVGCGLIFAGATDWCGMGLLLAKMPWNRAPK